MVPSYTSVARRSPAGGTVKAVVTIGPTGSAGKVDVGESDANLGEEVRNFLTRETAYSQKCFGKRVVLFFTFRLEGNPEPNPPVFVRFEPPNRFMIISRLQSPDF